MNFGKKIRALLAGACLCSLILANLSGCTPGTQPGATQETSGGQSGPYSKSTFALSTIIDITVYSEQDLPYVNDCFRLIQDYENKLSRTKADSEIGLLNSRKSNQVSEDTTELIRAGLHYSEISGGAYDIGIATLTSLWDFMAEDPQVPDAAAIQEAIRWDDYRAVHLDGTTVTFDNEETSLELGSIAKGFIADKVKEFLISKGVKSAMINLGGNVLLLGSKPDGSAFNIGIQKPFGSAYDMIGVVALSDLSMVTSGIYERYFEQDGKSYHHILNPRTGYPYENDLLSVTIIGPSSTDCDGLSTTCFSLGLEDGMKLIDSLPDYHAVFVSGDKDDPKNWEYHYSEGFADAIRYTDYTK